MSDNPLSGVVIAFDVDNTLVDPSGEVYRRTVTESLSRVDLGLAPEEAFDAHETVRSHGHILERLGLANLIHERGHPQTLALLCLTRGANPVLLGELHITQADRHRSLALLTDADGMHSRAQSGSLMSRLHAERNLRAWIRSDASLERFREDVLRIADHPLANEWAASYLALDHPRPLNAARDLLQALASRGAALAVITEGRSGIQHDKLSRAGLLETFGGRILISSAASDVAGLGRLDEAISERISAMDGAREDQALAWGNELVLLWYYRCTMAEWSSKTPWFYARCLHALQRDRQRPGALLRRPLYVPSNEWRANPLHFLMVGDRYDKDIEPLIDLLGVGVGMKIRFRTGKYAHLHPDGKAPVDRLPDRTFTDWDSLAGFLANELSAGDIKPITTPPDIVNRQDVRREIIERGLGSEFEAVRVVAQALAEMMA